MEEDVVLDVFSCSRIYNPHTSRCRQTKDFLFNDSTNSDFQGSITRHMFTSCHKTTKYYMYKYEYRFSQFTQISKSLRSANVTETIKQCLKPPGPTVWQVRTAIPEVCLNLQTEWLSSVQWGTYGGPCARKNGPSCTAETASLSDSRQWSPIRLTRPNVELLSSQQLNPAVDLQAPSQAPFECFRVPSQIVSPDVHSVCEAPPPPNSPSHPKPSKAGSFASPWGESRKAHAWLVLVAYAPGFLTGAHHWVCPHCSSWGSTSYFLRRRQPAGDFHNFLKGDCFEGAERGQ